MSTDTNDQTVPASDETLTNSLRENWRWLLVVGVLIAVGGLFASLTPFLTGVSVSLLLGLLLVAVGGLHFVGAFRAQGWRGVVWQLVLGVTGVVGGAALVLNPVFGLVTLTLLTIGYLFVTGVAELAMGLRLRGEENWLWTVASGAIGIFLAVLLWAGFPSTAIWAVGLMLGVNLLTTGIAMVALALGVRNLPEVTEQELTAGAGGV